MRNQSQKNLYIEMVFHQDQIVHIGKFRFFTIPRKNIETQGSETGFLLSSWWKTKICLYFIYNSLHFMISFPLFSSFQLSQDLGYVMYSAFGSFYIPSCIMVFVYIKIYYAARERARRVINKPGLAKRVSRRFTGKSNTAASAANTAASVAAANKKG